MASQWLKHGLLGWFRGCSRRVGRACVCSLSFRAAQNVRARVLVGMRSACLGLRGCALGGCFPCRAALSVRARVPVRIQRACWGLRGRALGGCFHCLAAPSAHVASHRAKQAFFPPCWEVHGPAWAARSHVSQSGHATPHTENHGVEVQISAHGERPKRSTPRFCSKFPMEATSSDENLPRENHWSAKRCFAKEDAPMAMGAWKVGPHPS